jgi:2-phospho-L-lactate guanylyltransferase
MSHTPRTRTARAEAGPSSRWTVVLPVKGGPAAKSRLGGPPELAAAIVQDSLDAISSCPEVLRVVVVSPDPALAGQIIPVAAVVVPERLPGAGLVEAVRDGVDRTGDRPGPVAVLLPDVPAARPEDIGAALRATRAALADRPAAPMAVVPDAEGTGTVLLAARSARGLDPAFGPQSAAEHVRRGAVRLDLDLPRLRRDVDTPADLRTVLELGAGPRTARLAPATLAPCRPPCTGSTPKQAPGASSPTPGS